MSSSTVTLDTKISSGSWTLYFHSPEETKWGIATFTKVGSMETWRDFWTVVECIEMDIFSDGMFFLMRDPIPPLWENYLNVRGGGYSFRIPKREAGEAFITYAIGSMINTVTESKSNQINGLSISPKKGFNIIKVWNTDSSSFKEPSDLKILIPGLKTEDIIYTPFCQKNM